MLSVDINTLSPTSIAGTVDWSISTLNCESVAAMSTPIVAGEADPLFCVKLNASVCLPSIKTLTNFLSRGLI